MQTRCDRMFPSGITYTFCTLCVKITYAVRVLWQQRKSRIRHIHCWLLSTFAHFLVRNSNVKWTRPRSSWNVHHVFFERPLLRVPPAGILSLQSCNADGREDVGATTIGIGGYWSPHLLNPGPPILLSLQDLQLFTAISENNQVPSNSIQVRPKNSFLLRPNTYVMLMSGF